MFFLKIEERGGRGKKVRNKCLRKIQQKNCRFRLEAEKQRAIEEQKKNYQKLLDEAKEYGLRKAILADSDNFFESKF